MLGVAVQFGVRFTVTVNVQTAVFPDGSVAVQVTVVVPGGKADPDAGEQATVTLQLSLAAGSCQLTIALAPPEGIVTKIFSGHVIVGGVLSMTVTV
jgi:hypothetical protein